MVSNKDIYSRTLPYAEKHNAERKVQREKKENKEKRKEKILITQERTNIGRESLEVSPQALNQSKREQLKEVNRWSSELSMS